LRDLEIGTRRKGGWKEIFQAYKPWDYRGLVEEWVSKEKVIEAN